MRLHISLPIMLAATIVARSVPNSDTNGSDPLNCVSFGEGCHLKLDVVTGVFRCSCTTNPDNLPDLAWFYTESNYRGIEYQGYGDYSTCKNLPYSWDKKTRSMKSNLDPSVICCVFTGADCDKEGKHWTPVDASVQEFQGFYALGVRSYMCNAWVDETSTCDGL